MRCHHFASAGLTLAVLLLIGSSATAQDPKTPDDPVIATLHGIVNSFFKELKNSPPSAFNVVLLKDSQQILQKKEAVAKLIVAAAGLEKKYGGYKGHDRISAKTIGSDLVLMKYLYKCSLHPVVWHFTFYRNFQASGEQNEWIVISVRFDTDLELLALEP